MVVLLRRFGFLQRPKNKQKSPRRLQELGAGCGEFEGWVRRAGDVAREAEALPLRVDRDLELLQVGLWGSSHRVDIKGKKEREND